MLAHTRAIKKRTTRIPARSRLVPDVGPLAAALALSLLVAACGGRPTPLTGDDGGLPLQQDSGTSTTADGSPGAPPTVPPTIPPSGCVVAIRIDNCCTSAFPAPAQQVAADPCLVPYPPTYPIDKACEAKWPKMCELVDCAFSPPVSRVAVAVPGGTCTWKSECATAADCRLAYDARRCCDCPAPWPLELVQSEPCIHDYLINTPPPKYCTGNCTGGDCKPCPVLPKAACVDSGTPGIKRCVAAAP